MLMESGDDQKNKKQVGDVLLQSDMRWMVVSAE